MFGGIPAELITGAVSSLMGAVFKAWGMKRQQERERELALIDASKVEANIIDSARRYSNEGFQMTRRAIALIVTFFVIAWPKIVAVFWPEVNVMIGYHEIQQGFLFFTDDKQVTEWVATKGLALTPLDTHSMMAVLGLYLGSSIVSRRH